MNTDDLERRDSGLLVRRRSFLGWTAALVGVAQLPAMARCNPFDGNTEFARILVDLEVVGVFSQRHSLLVAYVPKVGLQPGDSVHLVEVDPTDSRALSRWLEPSDTWVEFA